MLLLPFLGCPMTAEKKKKKNQCFISTSIQRLAQQEAEASPLIGFNDHNPKPAQQLCCLGSHLFLYFSVKYLLQNAK